MHIQIGFSTNLSTTKRIFCQTRISASVIEADLADREVLGRYWQGSFIVKPAVVGWRRTG